MRSRKTRNVIVAAVAVALTRLAGSAAFAADAAPAAMKPAAASPAPTVAAAPSRPLSPPATAETQIGGRWTEPNERGRRSYVDGKWIEVRYSRPIKRGREDLFGKGAEYGKGVTSGAALWRAGANQTTRFKTEAALLIAGKHIPAGEYSLFVDLKEGAWTLVLSSQPHAERYDPERKDATWGAGNYDPKFDVLRAPMTMQRSSFSIDQFTIGFVDVDAAGGKLAMAWDHEVAMVAFQLADPPQKL